MHVDKIISSSTEYIWYTHVFINREMSKPQMQILCKQRHNLKEGNIKHEMTDNLLQFSKTNSEYIFVFLLSFYFIC